MPANTIPTNILSPGWARADNAISKCVATFNNSNSDTDSEAHIQYEIGFEAPAGIQTKKAIHESIVIAALIKSRVNFPALTTYKSLDNEQWEFFRGLLWNDDPRCLLFKDSVDNNHDFGTGADFFLDFIGGPETGMTKRSHFGDLQVLHAMAPAKGEKAQDTKTNMMRWMEVMYRLACNNQGIKPETQLKAVFPGQFNKKTEPSEDATLQELLLGTTPKYDRKIIPRRALGVCMHIIGDSYAIGHMQRQLLNPKDLGEPTANGFITFKPGTTGKYGAIIAFHTYSGQNKDRHGHYDRFGEGPLPVPQNLETFNHILGARDAIEKTIALANFWFDRTNWDDGVRQFLDREVFELSPNVKVSDTNVDTNITLDSSLSLNQVTDRQTSFDISEKLSKLENGMLTINDDVAPRWRGWDRPTGKNLMMIALWLVLSVVTVLSIFTAVCSRRMSTFAG